MAILLVWTRLEVRRRRRALLVLALLVALSTATVLAAVAGARRADTAYDRLAERTLPGTLAVLPNQPGFDWDAVRALPGVAGVSEFAVTTFLIGELPNSAAAAGLPSFRQDVERLEVPVMLAGRLPDPDRVDEVVVTPRFLTTYDLDVGDRVDLRLFGPTQIDESSGTPYLMGAPTGPVVPATIVGVGRSPWFVDPPGSPGVLATTPALLERYPANLLGTQDRVSVNALVRLDDESRAAVAAFRDGLARVSGRSDIALFDQVERAAKLRDTVRFEAASLLAFGLAALAAALVLVGQAAARYVAAAVGELQVLRTVGMDRRSALAAAAVPAVLAGVIGVGVGVGVAVAVSPIFPIGTAADLEPAPGMSADPLVLGAGAAALVLLLVVGVVGAGLAALAARRRGGGRPSAVARFAARFGAPVPVLVGLRFALEPGRGRTALPVRPALVGAVTGVLGVLAAFTFSTGVAEAAGNPDRFGQTQRIETYTGFDGQDFVPDVRRLVVTAAADPDVASVVDSPIGVIDAGTGPVSVFTYDWAGDTALPTVLLDGRMPTGTAEIALGTATAAGLGVGVGDRVPATGNRGTAELTVTGIGFVPYAGHNDYDDGGWLTPDGYRALVDGFKFHVVYVALHPGADPPAVAARLTADVGTALGGEVPFEVSESLPETSQLRNVEVLPLVLGGFLALLAVGAVGHALATAVRRRSHDVAVLRALGMTRWQTRGIVLTQATALAAIGLAFGLPLGSAVGRVLWRLVADITPLQYEAPVALVALLLAVPVTVLVANALATWPGRRAAGLRIASVLRAE